MPNVTQTDLRFFTNEPKETLYDRFVQTLRDAQYFDVLVGYFRTSGSRQLYASMEGVEKTRILVGLIRAAESSRPKSRRVASCERTIAAFIRNPHATAYADHLQGDENGC